MTLTAPVPDPVLELTLCLRKGGCNNRRCQCVKSDTFYAKMCRCIDCQNNNDVK